jgi:hypothetical protein
MIQKRSESVEHSWVLQSSRIINLQCADQRGVGTFLHEVWKGSPYEYYAVLKYIFQPQRVSP